MLNKLVLLCLGAISPVWAAPLPAATPHAGYEAAADLLLQIPVQVDGISPVPLMLNMLQQDHIDSLSLLADREHPELIARFRYTDSLLPQLSTRLSVDRDTRILAVISSPDRLFAVKREVKVTTPKDVDLSSLTAGATHQSSKTNPAVSGNGRVQSSGESSEVSASAAIGAGGITNTSDLVPEHLPLLLIERDDDQLTVTVKTNESLLDQAPSEKKSVYVNRFTIADDKQELVQAELSREAWYKPFFQFYLRDVSFSGALTLDWHSNVGSEGKVVAEIADLAASEADDSTGNTE